MAAGAGSGWGGGDGARPVAVHGASAAQCGEGSCEQSAHGARENPAVGRCGAGGIAGAPRAGAAGEASVRRLWFVWKAVCVPVSVRVRECVRVYAGVWGCVDVSACT